MTTYIVVADAARARIFTRDALNLAEQESLVHAAGRLHEGDLITDRRGADVHESTSTSSRSSGEEGAASQHENELFVAHLPYILRNNSRRYVIMYGWNDG